MACENGVIHLRGNLLRLSIVQDVEIYFHFYSESRQSKSLPLSKVTPDHGKISEMQHIYKPYSEICIITNLK